MSRFILASLLQIPNCNMTVKKWSVRILMVSSWPSGKLPNWMSKKCPKLDIFSKKLTKIVLFFQWFWANFWHSFGNFPKGQVSRLYTTKDWFLVIVAFPRTDLYSFMIWSIKIQPYKISHIRTQIKYVYISL